MTTRKSNRFADLADTLEPDITPAAPPLVVTQERTVVAETPVPQEPAPAARPAEVRRPYQRATNGKRTRVGMAGDMIQTSIYLTKETHKQVKATLILSGNGDLSELAETLFAAWLKQQHP